MLNNSFTSKLAVPSRRTLLAGPPLVALGAVATEAAGTGPAIEQDLHDYIGFGAKNAGGAGDSASGRWIEERLSALGFILERQPVPASFVSATAPSLRAGPAEASVTCHDLGAAQTVDAVAGPASVWGAPGLNAPAAPGAIVVAHLPKQRWSSAQHPIVRRTVEQAFAQGAGALVLVTHGPTSSVILLNRPVEPGAHAGPIVLMAPRDWVQIQTHLVQNRPISLHLNARAETRQAFNVVARMDRGRGRWLVVSTPRSGWGLCAGERGPGIAAFLALGRWLPQRFPHHDLVFAAMSSHEFEYAGSAHFIEHLAPPPAATALWLHLGAGFAARDWHDTGERLLSLPSPDPQRFLVASPHLVSAARTAFSGLAGLEAAYPASEGASGELREVFTAGYTAVGMFGAHRHHHVASDDMTCIDPAHTAQVIERMKTLLEAGVTPL